MNKIINTAKLACVFILTSLLIACATPFPATPFNKTVPMALMPLSTIGITDERPRFREILCAVTEKRGKSLPDYRACDDVLTRVGDEPVDDTREVKLGKSTEGLTAIIVPGVAWDCFEDWLEVHEQFAKHVNQFGYNLTILKVEGLSSSKRNAEFIRDAVLDMASDQTNRKIALIGYSKGTNDILTALTAYPEVKNHVAAVVSVAGAVGGSPLASDADQDYLTLLTEWPGAKCTEGDGGVIDSLKPSVRQAWLHHNLLPKSLPYFSLVTLPAEEQISLALKTSYDRLSLIDNRNDGQLIYYDQLIPDSKLLGYLNADHWAVMVPIERSHEFIGATVATQNRFPREVLFETILRFVDEEINKVDN